MKQLQGCRILLIEDHSDSRATLAQLMRLKGCEVLEADNGSLGLKMAEAFKPDVVLVDLVMPRMDGYEVCNHIRHEAWGRNAVLIAVTGLGQPEDKQRCEEVGFNHHLLKPVRIDDLEQILASNCPA